MRSLWWEGLRERGLVEDSFLSRFGGSELSWLSPSAATWAVSGPSTKGMTWTGETEEEAVQGDED